MTRLTGKAESGPTFATARPVGTPTFGRIGIYRRSIGVVIFAVLLGGCTAANSSTDPTGMAKTEEIGRAAVQFAQCMRDHGYQIPDPTFDEEGFPVWGDVPGAVPEKGAEFEENQRTCMEPLRAAYQAAGVPNNKEVNAEELLAFTRCMREHGIDIPDPTAEEPLEIPKDAYNSPAWQPAAQACGSLLPESWRGVLEPPAGKPGGGR
jgi:hypothetical protein